MRAFHTLLKKNMLLFLNYSYSGKCFLEQFFVTIQDVKNYIANDYNALTGNKHDGASRGRFFLFLTYFVSRLQANFTRTNGK